MNKEPIPFPPVAYSCIRFSITGIKLLLAAVLTICLSLSADCRQKSNAVLRSVDIEFTYTEGGRNIRKIWKGLGEDPADGLYKPEHYDIVIRLNEGMPLAEYEVQVLIEEKILPTGSFLIGNERIPRGWVPVKTVYSGMATNAKKNMIVVSDPAYKLVYDIGSILYTKDALRIVVLCRSQKTGKIEYIRKEYEIPM